MYSPYKFKKADLDAVIEHVLPKLREVMAAHSATHVVVTGSSGISMMGVLVLNGFEVIQVRKDSEDTHGDSVEWAGGYSDAYRTVFLDDFVSSGATLRRVVEKLSARTQHSVEAVVCMADAINAPEYQWVSDSQPVANERGAIYLPPHRLRYDARFAKPAI